MIGNVDSTLVPAGNACNKITPTMSPQGGSKVDITVEHNYPSPPGQLKTKVNYEQKTDEIRPWAPLCAVGWLGVVQGSTGIVQAQSSKKNHMACKG